METLAQSVEPLLCNQEDMNSVSTIHVKAGVGVECEGQSLELQNHLKSWEGVVAPCDLSSQEQVLDV